jgi:hypothetical protein
MFWCGCLKKEKHMSLTKICPTKRALDAGDSAAFSGIFLALSFPAPEQNPRPPQRQ